MRRSLRVVSKRAVLVVLPVLVAWLGGAAAVGAATPRQAAAHRRVAVRVADRLLDYVVVPAGATKVPAGPLTRSIDPLFLAAAVDRHAFWTTDASPAAVISQVGMHLPAGAKLTNAGSGFGPGSSNAWAEYTFPRTDRAVLGIRQLVVEADAGTHISTAVRADGEVQYFAPRRADQRIPASAHVLDIAMTKNRRKPLLSVTVTRLTTVRRIAALVNALPFGNFDGVGFSCPAFTSSDPVDAFTFRATPAGPALARVSELAATPTYIDGCETATLRIRGHLEPPLVEGGTLLRRAGAILHVKLTSS
jgi:hypothetical protein